MRTDPIQQTDTYILAETCKLLRAYAGAKLDEIGLHLGQDMIVIALTENEGATQSDLADNLRISAPTIAKALRRMERDGWVERKTDPDDQRISRVFLTPNGRSLHASVQKVYDRVSEILFEGYTTEERVLMRRLLMQMHENLAKVR